MINLEQEAQEVAELSARIGQAVQTVRKEELELDRCRARLVQTQSAQEILQLIAQAVQQQVHQRISEVVSSCLSTVFDDPYQFHIQFERKRGRTEARLRFLRRGLDIDPLTASGGGMVDVAAFALRVACLILHRPRLSRVICLDEPFKFVSAQYRENVRAMLEGLASDMGMQIVMVTHIDELETGKIIEL
jgi:DNA repair exonuclease SbcCD ATPase subunit